MKIPAAQPGQYTPELSLYAGTWSERANSAFPAEMPHREVYMSLFAALGELDDEDHQDDQQTVFATLTHKNSKTFTQEDLDAIQALPHSDPDKVFVLDMEAYQGRRFGGCSVAYLCSGALTQMVVDVSEGMHLRKALLNDWNPQRREIGQLIVQQLHKHWPDRVPSSIVESAYKWAEPIGHDAGLLTGNMLMEELGADGEVLIRV